MAHICVASESRHIDSANSLVDTICRLTHDVRLVTEVRYPVGDAMTVFLGIMDRDFDATFVLISTSPQASGWILKELRLRHLYPTCFPVLLDRVAIPEPWPDSAPLYRIADGNKSVVNDVLQQSVSSGPPTTDGGNVPSLRLRHRRFGSLEFSRLLQYLVIRRRSPWRRAATTICTVG